MLVRRLRAEAGMSGSSELDKALREMDAWRMEAEAEKVWRGRLEHEVDRLRAALNKAGDRLAQVQPAVTEPWAYDIVPKAEQEIADALGDWKP